MSKIAIFEQVVDLVCEHSATKKDYPGADPTPYREQIREDMSDRDFVLLVQRYLTSFNCLHHLTFYDPTDQQVYGFGVRYYEGALYVTKAVSKTGLLVGDKITHLAGLSIEAFAKEHPDYFVSKTPERQGHEWVAYLAEAKVVTLERFGQVLTVTIGQVSQDDLPKYQPFAFEQLTADTLYLKLENFSDNEGIANLYDKASSALSQSKNLIIDVRVNHGGSDGLYYPLLPYLLEEGQTLSEVVGQPEYGMEILYTERNVDLRLAEFDDYLENSTILPEEKAFVEAFRMDLLAKRGKGFVRQEDLGDSGADKLVGLAGGPERVIVLSDVTCGSSGDNFVWVASLLDKVTVMGRPTMGILDYANCCSVSLDQFRLVFPTSRYLGLDAGQGLTDRGILPDVDIPWTPKHLEQDVDLQLALDALSQ